MIHRVVELEEIPIISEGSEREICEDSFDPYNEHRPFYTTNTTDDPSTGGGDDPEDPPVC